MLQLDDLRVVLDSDAGLVRALDGLSLTLQRGETYALVGESGCGKSMTALAMMRLLPDSGRIAGGRVLLSAAVPDAKPTELLALTEVAMRRMRGGRIGIIFQEPATCLNPVMRVGDQIVEAIETHTALRGDTARRKAIEWLERVGIPEPQRRIDSYPFEMSGGQKQRVMIAMTLAAEPEFLIADEPTTALDVMLQKQVLDLLKDLQRERRLGLLLITHDLSVVATMAQRVALMYAGQIVEEAPAEVFFKTPRHPYAHLLLQALPDAERRGQALAAIVGSVPPLTQHFKGCRFAPRCGVAQTRCSNEAPVLVADDRHAMARKVRCWFPEAQTQVVRAQPLNVTSSMAAASTAMHSPFAQTPTRQKPVLDVSALNVVFSTGGGLWRKPTANRVVADVSFKIFPGQTLALVGESGCGKTTTGRAVVQLLRGQIGTTVSGQAWLQNEQGRQDLFCLQSEALREARRAVQMVFQDPFASLNPRMRVDAILEEGLVTLRPDWSADQRRATAQDWVEKVGLRADVLTRFPHEFSGGQRQRLAIARALAVSPQVLVCDEPTSALDVSVQAQILNLLRQLQADLGLGMLFITHNLGVVSYLADHIAVMRGGVIVEQGLCEAVLNSPQNDYTRALWAAVPRRPN